MKGKKKLGGERSWFHQSSIPSSYSDFASCLINETPGFHSYVISFGDVVLYELYVKIFHQSMIFFSNVGFFKDKETLTSKESVSYINFLFYACKDYFN